MCKYKELKCREINVNGYNKDNKWNGGIARSTPAGATLLWLWHNECKWKVIK